MDLYTKTVQGLVAEFERLPGIGRKTAERLAYYILRAPADEAMSLAYAIRDVKKKVRHCSTCFNLTEADICEICSDPERDQATLCVVEQPKDLFSIETSGSYRGLYHVLLGAYAPLDGTNAEDLTVEDRTPHAEPPGVLHDGGKPSGHVVEVARVDAHVVAGHMELDADAVEFPLHRAGAHLLDCGVCALRSAREHGLNGS